jgi:hypothetical protein
MTDFEKKRLLAMMDEAIEIENNLENNSVSIDYDRIIRDRKRLLHPVHNRDLSKKDFSHMN